MLDCTAYSKGAAVDHTHGQLYNTTASNWLPHTDQLSQSSRRRAEEEDDKRWEEISIQAHN